MLLLVLLLAVLPLSGQVLKHTLQFDRVGGQAGTGYVKVYDDRTVEYVGNGGKSFRHSFKMESVGTVYDTWLILYSHSGTKETRIKYPYIILMGDMAFYYDERNANAPVQLSMGNNREGRNEAGLAAMLTAFENHTGAFASFRTTAELELPLTIEGYSTTYRTTVPASAYEKAYSVRTKSGKYVDDTSLGSYEAWSDASWATIKAKTNAAILLSVGQNTTGATRTANVYVKAGDKTTQMVVTQPPLKALVRKVWVDHNARSGLVKGMRIHVQFDTYGVRGLTGYCTAYFSFANGTRLMDYNGNYRATDGQVSCSGSFVSNYDSTTFNDFVLFMPYSELHINGSADCKFQVQVSVGGQWAASEDVTFRIY